MFCNWLFNVQLVIEKTEYESEHLKRSPTWRGVYSQGCGEG